ncbi:MAG: microcystin degradation protein MlrC [Pelagibacterium sp. SCN 63-23]|nr:MAG: microcystin degradation protein MlrC [Pelagibacterium sp. SCN 63-23]
MRIAVGGIHIECSTYNPVLTRQDEFRVTRGQDLSDAPYFAFLKDYPAEFIPLIHARCVPGAPVERKTYEGFKAEFLDGLRAALPIDGLYLPMHGAMNVEGMEDAEGDWIAAAREVVGPDLPISTSYDLHGNLSQKIIDQLDMYSTYRTAPHIDVEETMRRSVSMLVKSIETGERPHVVWAPIPVVLPGERTSTVDEPAKSIYAMLPGINQRPGIWDASLNVGYVWADEPRATAAAVLTGTDRAALEDAAREIAQVYWDARGDFVFGAETGSIENCVAQAVASETAPVVLAESGDNPTGGGVGDRAELLAALVAANAQGTLFAGIADLPATEAAYAAGVGASREFTIGATLDTKGSKPFTGTFEVRFLARADSPAERQAVLRLGGIDLVVTARRRPFHNIADFTALGLDPNGARIIAVKSGYLSPELAPIANPNLLILSPGVVDQDIERLERKRKLHPTYPFDQDFVFTPRAIASARA